MAYKELEVDELIEIDSVSSFIRAVKDLKESADGSSTELYFRGQDAEFWDIEPSVFSYHCRFPSRTGFDERIHGQG